ncbi:MULTISPECIES: GntR family transcriptional regulator [unclassified Modicisalibacter]|uniref:GntR family transcriptional regulator n=1 Tax=unclassified Modicisalibacter TaxID=2679913 RepID=UPI001CCDABF0|nr:MULTISPECIES: GntR family transcriptional regulator [unclassified Modicisalibacter]MBZ9557940.1 GntR family transcriptional regulator [Modicisalibacter sp. R2A 31.J]MBZ9573392.1 GntR family transcriptional regulator [Modicisalibacter sp. MOD 31.J]
MAGTAKRHGGRYIYETLRRRILTLEIKPGSPLDEVSLAEHFNLSRSPVRDALARLMSEGLVTVLSNRSAIVKPIEFDQLPRYIDALDLVQRAVTRLAAGQRTASDLEAIHAKNQEYMAAVEQSDFCLMSEKNKEFHLRISLAAGNPYFTQYYETLLDEGQRLIHLQLSFIVSDMDRQIGNDHEDIIQAITAGDADWAEKAAHEHTELFRKRFIDYLSKSHSSELSLDWIDQETETTE